VKHLRLGATDLLLGFDDIAIDHIGQLGIVRLASERTGLA
jgi:hypothetical protein